MKLVHNEPFAFLKFSNNRCMEALNKKQLSWKSKLKQLLSWEPVHYEQDLRNLDFITSCKINLSFSICKMVNISALKIFRENYMFTGMCELCFQLFQGKSGPLCPFDAPTRRAIQQMTLTCWTYLLSKCYKNFNRFKMSACLCCYKVGIVLKYKFIFLLLRPHTAWKRLAFSRPGAVIVKSDTGNIHTRYSAGSPHHGRGRFPCCHSCSSPLVFTTADSIAVGNRFKLECRKVASQRNWQVVDKNEWGQGRCQRGNLDI